MDLLDVTVSVSARRSYVDQLNISVLSDGSTFDDPHEVTDAMVDEFVEIRGAAGLSEELTVVETAMAP